MNENKNELLVTTQSEHEWPEERLAIAENDINVAKAVIMQFYDGLKEVPLLDDVMEYVTEYNNDIIYEIADVNQYDTCKDCFDHYKCWYDGFPPEARELWNEKYRELNDMLDGCYCDSVEVTVNSIEYNYASWHDLPEYILEVIAHLNYSVILENHNLEYIYLDPPHIYFQNMKVYFNDAQGVLIPEFTKAWNPRPYSAKYPLLITA